MGIYSEGVWLSNFTNLANAIKVPPKMNFKYQNFCNIIKKQSCARTMWMLQMGNDESNSCQIIEPKPKGCCDKLSLYISSGKVDPS